MLWDVAFPWNTSTHVLCIKYMYLLKNCLKSWQKDIKYATTAIMCVVLEKIELNENSHELPTILHSDCSTLPYHSWLCASSLETMSRVGYRVINWRRSKTMLWTGIQGLVKGAELCLNPYFFGWLEKWVFWL